MALTIIHDFDKLTNNKGVISPAECGGEALLKRLINSNIKFFLPDTFAPEIDEDVFPVIETKFVEKSDKDQYDMTFEVLVKVN